MSTDVLPRRKSRLITPYRVIVSSLISLAVAAIIVGFMSSKDPEPTLSRPTYVVSFSPGEGSTTLRQARIYAELKPGYTGVLLINSVEIPEDQLDHLEGANFVGFTPGAGTEITSLEPGPNCATVVFWQPEAGRRAADSFKWCWQVH